MCVSRSRTRCGFYRDTVIGVYFALQLVFPSLIELQVMHAADVEDDNNYVSMIFVGDSDGSNLKPLTKFDQYQSQGSPCWTADGRMIAFDAFKPQLNQQFYDGHLIIIDADGKNPKDLGLGILPSLSPKGHRIAFCRHPRTGERGVYIMDVSDPDQRALIDENGWGPEWSPDGRWLAYLRDQNIQLYDLIEGTVTPVLDLERSGIRNINFNYCWSNDSRRIAFKAVSKDDEPVIAIAEVPGENQIARIVMNGKVGDAVAFRPLQNDLLFQSVTGEQPEIQVLASVNPAKPSEVVRMQTNLKGRRVYDPAISPDGKRLAISSFSQKPAKK